MATIITREIGTTAKGAPLTNAEMDQNLINLNDQGTTNASAIALKANIASPTFTGQPRAPTATLGTNDTQLATTGFVQSALGGVALPTAAQVSFTPSGNIASNNVQAAIQEVDSEKLSINGGTINGTLVLAPGGGYYVQATVAGGSAPGMYTLDAGGAITGGVGANYTNGVMVNTYLGIGPSPWSNAITIDLNGYVAIPNRLFAHSAKLSGFSDYTGYVKQGAGLNLYDDGVAAAYGISVPPGGGMDIMANQVGASVRVYAGTDQSSSTQCALFNNSTNISFVPHNFRSSVSFDSQATLGPQASGELSQALVCNAPGFSTAAAYLGRHVTGNWAGAAILCGNSVFFDFHNDGNAYAPVAWISNSDGRLKKDREVLTDALNKVNSLTGYTYLRADVKDYYGNPTTVRNAGLIAQDVEAVLPEAVSHSGEIANEFKTADDEGDIKAVDYNSVVALLVEAVKELKGEVDTLRAQVAELQS